MTSFESRACKGLSPKWFVGPLTAWETERAKDVCKRCPVVDACRDFSDEVEVRDPLTRHYQQDWCGVWGGEDPAERAARRGLPGLMARPYIVDKRRCRNSTTEHGTRACYTAGCRRFECCEAHRYWQREYRRRREGVATTKVTTKPKHGTVRCYRNGCRKDECRAANAAERRKERQFRKIRRLRDHWANCKKCGDVFKWTTPRLGGDPIHCERHRAKTPEKST